jgi:hypothetical protein
MLFAVEMSVETIALLTTTIGGGVSVVFWQMLRAKDELAADLRIQVKDLKEDNKSHRQIGDEAVTALETVANQKRAADGKPPFKALASVVPEENSPVSEEQQRAADLQTSRAKLVAAKLILELPPREPGTPETAEERTVRIDAEKHGTSSEYEPVNLQHKPADAAPHDFIG